MSAIPAVKTSNEAISYAFTDAQIQQIQAIRKAFNNFTGESFNLTQFIDFMIKDAIIAELKACNATLKVMKGMPRFAGQDIKPVQKFH